MKGTLHNLLALLLVAAPTATQAQAGWGDGYAYYTNAGNMNTITLDGFDFQNGDPTFASNMIIPTNINGLLVTGIGSFAFSGIFFYFPPDVTSVTIPGTVTSIGEDAFDGSDLTNVALSCGLTSIGPGAFANTSLTNITIPASVTNIGPSAFACFSMEAITVEAQNSYYSSSNGVLFDKNQTTFIEFPGSVGGSYTVPSSVTSIGYGAFENGTNLTNIIIPNSVTNIGPAAFWQCFSLTNITIPDSVTSIGDYAFLECMNLTNVFFGGNAPTVGVDGFNYSQTVYYLPGTTGWDAFAASTGLSPVLWNPLIQTGDGSFGVRNNQFGFNITGTTNIPIVVEACASLASPVWMALTNVSLANGSFYFSEPVQSNASGRYYRISSP